MIKNFNDYRDYLNADALANSISRKRNLKEFFKELILPNRIWCFIRVLRKAEYFKNNAKKNYFNKFMFLIYYIKYRKLSYKLNFSIPLNVFGPGLSIPHYGTIIVNANTRIGKNCRIHASVNIGASGGSDKAPFIGDNVYIGPGAILYGDISIAHNVTIAANATVNKSFLTPNITIGGTPAIVLKENTAVWWEKNGLIL